MNFEAFSADLAKQFDALCQLLQQRKDNLLEFVAEEQERKKYALREQVTWIFCFIRKNRMFKLLSGLEPAQLTLFVLALVTEV